MASSSVMLMVILLLRNLFLRLQGRQYSGGFLTDMSHSIVKFSLIFWATYVIWSAKHVWIGREDHWLGKHVKQEQGSKSTFAIAGGIFAGVLLGYLISKTLHAEIGSEEIRWLGVAIVILGLIFNFWAIRTLGRFFRTIIITHDDHQLITTGLYKRFRHPSYFASLLILLGMGLALDNWWTLLVILGLPFVTFVYRIRVEE